MTPKQTSRPWILIAVVVGILLVLGYGVNAMMSMASRKVGETMMERAIERSTGGDADVDFSDDGKMEVKTKDGTFTTGQEMPKDWPSDGPVYPGSEVQYSASVNPTNGKPGKALVLMTKDAPDVVNAYYKAELEKQGWTISNTAQVAGGMMMAGTKDNRVFSVMIAATDGRTTISVGVGEE